MADEMFCFVDAWDGKRIKKHPEASFMTNTCRMWKETVSPEDQKRFYENSKIFHCFTWTIGKSFETYFWALDNSFRDIAMLSTLKCKSFNLKFFVRGIYYIHLLQLLRDRLIFHTWHKSLWLSWSFRWRANYFKSFFHIFFSSKKVVDCKKWNGSNNPDNITSKLSTSWTCLMKRCPLKIWPFWDFGKGGGYWPDLEVISSIPEQTFESQFPKSLYIHPTCYKN